MQNFKGEKWLAAKIFFKFFLTFTGGLYCVGFGLSKGRNYFGGYDNLLPFEWCLLLFVGFFLLAWAAATVCKGFKLLK
jgi:hypothetical protein